MEEWLTTGEMIEKINVGDIYINNSGHTEVFFEDDKLHYRLDGFKESYIFFITTYRKEKWRIKK